MTEPSRDNRIRAALRHAGRGVGFSFRSHPLRWWLASFVAAVTAATVGLGAIRIQGADSAGVSDSHAKQLTSLAGAVTRLAFAIEDEQNDVAVYVGEGRPRLAQQASNLLLTQGQASVTQDLANQFFARVGRPGAEYPPQTRAALRAVLNRLSSLPALERTAVQGREQALAVINDYSFVISSLLAFDDQLASGSGDPVFVRDVSVFSALLRAEDAAVQEWSILDAALAAGRFQPGEAQRLSVALGQERAELAEFDSAATAGQRQMYARAVTGQQVEDADSMLAQASAARQQSLNVVNPPGSPFPNVQTAWNEEMGFTVDQMRQVDLSVLASATLRSQALQAQTAQSILETWIEMAVVILAVVALAVAITWWRRSRSARGGVHPAAG